MNLRFPAQKIFFPCAGNFTFLRRKTKFPAQKNLQTVHIELLLIIIGSTPVGAATDVRIQKKINGKQLTVNL
jgi:hypothetical protein